ncbi:ABC transporter ATP-binding protein [Brachyspira catarrhinii]|uniref:ABC transporter ATP-binding protein n=1 Tax=Brachyspira catarrhinii TaxID=2528966 RepID=A0ABY2TSX6_9SPIR|nr:ABC transporter ATP-binding protein [Brachyspira catarrhinii]TKZ35920.1 ABC transporter ATP-binding protein [Brachyspira catarrhinii]
MNIKIINISKTFNLGVGKFKACEDISLDINQGDFISFVGHTGSGKSTLLSMIGGILNPSEGSIYYDSYKLENPSEEILASFRREYFSYIFQYPVIVPTLNVIDNILMPLSFKHKITEEEIKQTKKNIELFSLKEKTYLKASNLSGGEMKKVSILRALAYGCKCLIADEPTSDLDPSTTKTLMEIFTELNKNGTTIVMVTHAHNIAAHANNVYEMSDGRIVRCLK